MGQSGRKISVGKLMLIAAVIMFPIGYIQQCGTRAQEAQRGPKPTQMFNGVAAPIQRKWEEDGLNLSKVDVLEVSEVEPWLDHAWAQRLKVRIHSPGLAQTVSEVCVIKNDQVFTPQEYTEVGK